MYFISTKQMSSFILLALTCFSASIYATPAKDEDGFNDGIGEYDLLQSWPQTNFQPDNERFYGREGLRGLGRCLQVRKPRTAKSAKAPRGFKCTIYSREGCLGWRTREFNYEEGIADMGPKMNANGVAWRCCKIGTTNDWGYCHAQLNGGS